MSEISPIKFCLLWLTVFSGSLLIGFMADAQNFNSALSTHDYFASNISYGPYGQEKLDLCRPTNTAIAHPGIIMIHGGGWSGGDKGEMDNWCHRFADRGFVAVSVNYRLANEHEISPHWPAFQIADVQLAIRWMRQHANEINLNPRYICAYGTSAGGYLTMFAGTLRTILPSDVSSIMPQESVILSCLADAFAPVDFTIARGKKIEQLTGMSKEQDPELYKKDSPLFHIDSLTPPTLVIHGTKDGTVNIIQSENLVSTLKQNNIPVEYITYDGDHGYKGASSEEMNQIFQHLIQFFHANMEP